MALIFRPNKQLFGGPLSKNVQVRQSGMHKDLACPGLRPAIALSLIHIVTAPEAVELLTEFLSF